MRRLVILAAVSAALIASARAQIWIMAPANQGATHAFVPQPTGDILLVDNASFILQVDNTSLICRAGGC